MIINEIVTIEEVKRKFTSYFPERVKFCIDRKRKKIALGEEMHHDMEYELYDDGSDDRDIFGGDLYIDPISIKWESHPNIARNMELGIGTGRLLTDITIIDELTEILKSWIK